MLRLSFNNLKIMNTDRMYRFCLISILIFSGFIYLYNLDKESLVADEYFSFHVARLPLKEIIFDHQTKSNPNTIPPLYEVILHFWLKIFGISEYAQRAFSAILGILSVYILYKLARLLFDAPTGILSALFGSLSFSWFCFFRHNRCYSLFIFLTLFSFYVFFYFLKNKDSKLSLPILVIINIALTYTNYFAFLVILIELVFSIFEWRQNRQWVKKILVMCIWIISAYGPWYPNLFYDIHREPLMNIKLPQPDMLLRLLIITMILFSDFHIRWDPSLMVLYLPLITVGWIKLSKEKGNFFKHLFLWPILILVIPFIIIYLLTLSDRIRYYAPFSFPLFVILALGIQKIKILRFKKIILFPLVILIAVFNFMDFYDFFSHPLNENWKGAAQYIKQIPNYEDEEMVFLFQAQHNLPVFAYYYWNRQIADAFINNIADFENYDNDLLAIDTKHKIYLISEAINDKRLFEKIAAFPDDAWIWLFRYHQPNSSFYLRLYSKDKYFLHQVPLNPELPGIDLFLFKRINR